MTVTVITTNTRSTSTTTFAVLPDNIAEYIKTTYQDTGKLLSIDSHYSEDQLIRTTTLVFNNPVELHDYNYDTILTTAFATIRNYNSINGISHQRTIVNT
jgi:hypothetical protein